MADPYYKLMAGWVASVEYGNWISNSANPLTGLSSSASVVTSESAILGPVDVGSQAYLLSDATGGSLHVSHEAIGLVEGQQFSLTAYAQKHASKPGEMGLQYWEDGPQFVGFNIQSGTVILNTGTGTPYYKNRGGGWHRFGVTWTPGSVGAAQDLGIVTIGSGQNYNYAQDAGDPRGFYFAGMKVEAGPVSDYRVTTGTAENGSLTVAQSLAQVPDEDVYAIRVKRKVADIFNTLKVGTGTFSIDSTRGQYIRSLQINQGVVVKAVTDTNSEYCLFTGRVRDWSVNPGLGEQVLTVRAVDAAEELRQIINLPLAIDTTISSLMVDVLSTSGFDADRREVSTAMYDDVSFGNFTNVPANRALFQLIQAGVHTLWIDGNGKVVTRARDAAARGLTAVESLTTFMGYSVSASDDKVVNRVLISSDPFVQATEVGTVGWIEDSIFVPASATVTFAIEHVDPDTLEPRILVNSFAALVSSQDYYFDSVQEKVRGRRTFLVGANRTSELSFTVTHFGDSTEVVAKNNSTFDGWITRFQLRGLPLQPAPPIRFTVDVDSSQVVYGVRAKTIKNDLISSALKAKDFAEYITVKHKDDAETTSVYRKNEFPGALQRDLMDAIHIINSATNVASTFLITGVEHTITLDRGLEHTNAYDLDLGVETDWLILDDATLGVLDSRKVGV